MTDKPKDCNSVFSPVQVHTPQQSQGNLTGHLRKVKDLAADLHNYIMKWEAYNAQGMEIVTRIANLKIEKVFNVQESEELQKPSLPQDLSPLCDRLTEIIDSMEVLVKKMSIKTQNTEGLVALEKFQTPAAGSSSILFSTMTLRDVATTARDILTDYQQELQLKRKLLGCVAHASNREESEAMAACWLHQPYITSQSEDLLQALLKETGHVK